MKPTRIVELIIADDSEELAIDAISLVSSPAIMENFVFFGKEKNNLTFAKVDEEKRMLISPALIPNKQIFRHDPNTDSDYYVYFSKATVEKAAFLYLKHNNHHKATYQHQDRVSGVLTVESWIKEGDSDKSKLYGFDLPNGTWFVKMKIENDELWEKIKSGELKGLSIEGYFTNKFEDMQKKEFTDKEVKTALKELLSVQNIEFTKSSDGKSDMFKVAEKILTNARGLLDEFENNKKRAARSIKSLNTTQGKVDKIYVKITEEITKAAKELGVAPNDVPDFKKFQSSYFFIEKNINEEIEQLKKFV